ncbi:competence type IV pilus minor pilin ComGF [Amphibacillus marinus]|uniref:competence type IV pilus minor pilin ComGF n=1 Tax=Amphibacillus marinus TaxID=872970 RepID=UPI0015A699D3|nr:competence type IV pilus minor pilin ComGF [Amphibacillus marinus]
MGKIATPKSIISRNNQSGFTLLEGLLALVLMSVLLSFVPTIWLLLITPQKQTELYSVQQFFHVLADEIQQGVAVSRSSEAGLTIETATGDHVQITKYNDLIRRQVNRAGHEILLRDVKTFKVSHHDTYLAIQIKTTSGRYYEKNITPYYDAAKWFNYGLYLTTVITYVYAIIWPTSAA